MGLLTTTLKKINKNNFKYILRAVKNRNQEKQCPFCSSKSVFQVVDTKFLFTKLLRCNTCQLNFRFPTDTEAFYSDFYQEDYEVDVHMMTDLPSDDRLAILMKNNFNNLRDYSPYIKALFPDELSKLRVFDYGCSWGYNVFKLRNSGFDAEGFEVSKPRARYGKKLGLDIATDINEIRENNDVFFNSHVIEHLGDIKKFIELSKQKLTEGGIFIAFCPNGSQEFRNRKPVDFHGLWGLLHPNYLDINFSRFAFQANPYIIMTGDWAGTCEAEYNLNELQSWDGKSQVIGSKKDGDELMIVAKPNTYLRNQN